MANYEQKEVQTRFLGNIITIGNSKGIIIPKKVAQLLNTNSSFEVALKEVILKEVESEN